MIFNMNKNTTLRNSKNLKKNIFLFGFWISIIGGYILSLAFYYSNSYLKIISFAFNADLLFPANLIQDILRGNNISQWHITHSPFLIPDMALSAFAHLISPRLQVASFACGVTQYTLWVVLIASVYRYTLPYFKLHIRLALATLISLFFVIFIEKLDFLNQIIFINAFHFGITLLIPLILICVYKILIDQSVHKSVFIFFLSIISFLASLSDALYITQISIPLIATLLVSVALSRFSLKKAAEVILATLISSGAGVFVYLIRIWSDPSLKEYFTRDQSLKESFVNFYNIVSSLPVVHLVLILIFAGFCIYICISSIINNKRRGDIASEIVIKELNAWFFVACFASSILTAIFSGLITNNALSLRYLLPVLIFPSFWGFPMLFAISKTFSKKVFVPFLWAGIILLSIFTANGIQTENLSAILNYYPEFIECIDKNLGATNFKHGIANYWDARPISLLSKTGLNIAQVNRDLSRFIWLNNTNIYNAKPEFAVIDTTLPLNHPWRLDENLIIKRFGEPDMAFQCQKDKVLVYSREENNFRNLFEANSGARISLNKGLRAGSIDSIKYDTKSMQSTVTGWMAYSDPLTYTLEIQLDGRPIPAQIVYSLSRPDVVKSLGLINDISPGWKATIAVDQLSVGQHKITAYAINMNGERWQLSNQPGTETITIIPGPFRPTPATIASYFAAILFGMFMMGILRYIRRK